MTCDPKNNPCTAQCSAACGERRVSVEGGKYTVVIGDDGSLSALRHGEPWQDLTGNKMVYCLATELEEAREQRRIAIDHLRRLADDSRTRPVALAFLERVK